MFILYLICASVIFLLSLSSFIYMTSIHSGKHKDENILVSNSLKIKSEISENLGKLEMYIKSLENEILKEETTNKVVYDETIKKIDHLNENINAINNDIPYKFANSSSSNSNNGNFKEASTKDWLTILSFKLGCLRLRKGSIFLYHTRKSAGTSIRDILTLIAGQWHVPYYETEGIVLNKAFIQLQGVLTVTTLREPINRIMSLYWYEHVGWFDGVLKQTDRCKTLSQWVEGWRDGSPWKKSFMSKNPSSVYVEIENYYVKMLSGWQSTTSSGSEGDGQSSSTVGVTVTRQDLMIAKKVLEQFDIVLLSDWMGDATQIEAMNALFPGRQSIAAGHKIKGDANARVKLTPQLAPDEAEVRQILMEMNKYDLELWEFAQSLMAYRLKLIPQAVKMVKHELGLDTHLNTVIDTNGREQHVKQCHEAQISSSINSDRALLKQYIGIFQPPGHKGPF